MRSYDKSVLSFELIYFEARVNILFDKAEAGATIWGQGVYIKTIVV